MATHRQQLTIDTKKPATCVGAVGAPYIVSYAPNSGGDWDKKGADINGEAANDYSGYSVSLSRDGNVVAIGAPYPEGGGDAGHVRVYAWNGTIWEKRGGDIDGEGINDFSGVSVSLSSDGSIVAIGAYGNDGVYAPSVSVGHVRVYQYDATKTTAQLDKWQAGFGPIGWNRLGADIDGEGGESGASVSLSDDGLTVAIGAWKNDDGGENAGHVRVYQYDATKTTAETDQSSPDFGPVGWNRVGADINGEAGSDVTGWSVSLNGNGSAVSIGAPYVDTNGLINSGQVRVYKISSLLSPQVGDWAIVEHKETISEQILATYTYRVTQVIDADVMILEFVSATNGYTDDLPCDLCDGTGGFGTCEGIAPHIIKRDLGGTFIILMD